MCVYVCICISLNYHADLVKGKFFSRNNSPWFLILKRKKVALFLFDWLMSEFPFGLCGIQATLHTITTKQSKFTATCL